MRTPDLVNRDLSRHLAEIDAIEAQERAIEALEEEGCTELTLSDQGMMDVTGAIFDDGDEVHLMPALVALFQAGDNPIALIHAARKIKELLHNKAKDLAHERAEVHG